MGNRTTTYDTVSDYSQVALFAAQGIKSSIIALRNTSCAL